MCPINFNALPQNKPNMLPEPGRYIAKIQKPEMRSSKDDPTKPQHLNMQLLLSNPDGTGAGSMFDMLTESDNEIPRYKLQRFITALEIPIVDYFELKDIAKIIDGKQFIVDITHDKKGVAQGYAPKAVVDLFTGEAYYPMSMASELFDMPFNIVDNSADIINAVDAEDGKQATSTPDIEY